ncbi:tyrosine-type recombinase/integrase [Bacillus sp. FSL W7-1360]
MADGSILEEGNGRYRLVVELPTTVDVNGKKKRNRRTKTIQASGPRAAKKALQEFKLEKEREFAAAEKKQARLPFVTFVQEKWLKNFAEDYYAHTTLQNYTEILNARILPSFSELWLDQVTTMHIVEYFNELSSEGMRKDGKKGKLSDSTIELHHRVLKSIFKQAVLWEFIKEDENPMDRVMKPKVKTKEKDVYDSDTVHKLFDALDKEDIRWRCTILLAVSSGLRREEILGLESKHIDYDKSVLMIRQAVTHSKKEGLVVGGVKTRGSTRNLHVSSFLLELLGKLDKYKQEERRATGTNWRAESVFLFSDQNGKPFNPYSVGNWWRKFVKRNGFKYIPFHSLRHTSATILINRGIHAKVISSILGHSNIATTMNVYGHTLKEANKAAADVFEEFHKKNS